MRSIILSLSCAAALLTGCSQEETPAPETTTVATPKPPPATAVVSQRIQDESSFSEPHKVSITDIALNLALDFDKKEIAGTAVYTLTWKDKAAQQLILDTRDLTIEKVEAKDASGALTPLQFQLAVADKIFGSKLTIEAPNQPATIQITYRTSPNASGLQWLEPSMTEGKNLPFMFSQSQAIHARSWVPLQDTPSVRFTYTAEVNTRPDVMVLMSANNDPRAVRDGSYSFKMPQAIPSYLLSIAAGDLEFKPISARSGVWAEPTMVDKATKEFSDTEKMIQAAEELYGPYRWERYDMLVLPPSFPFGGMENPRITFATPTVVVGDKSLVSLIAHELAHSWSGNLVTNASWKDIWLNEGFTTYVQGRITESLYGAEVAEMERQIDQTDLFAELEGMSEADQALALPPLTERDPDDALSSVAYIKGAWFLSFLEERFGREVFDPFLRAWFDDHAFQSVTTDEFVAYMKKNLLSKDPAAVKQEELDAWLNKPGIPEFATKAESRRFNNIDTAQIAWQGTKTPPAKALTKEWTTFEWVRFIDGIGKTSTPEDMKKLDDAFQFTGTANAEIAMRWYPLAIRSGYTAAKPAIAEFLQKIGRRKLILPIYSELVKTPEGYAFASEVFAKAEPGYHPITTESVQAILDKAPAESKIPPVPKVEKPINTEKPEEKIDPNHPPLMDAKNPTGKK